MEHYKKYGEEMFSIPLECVFFMPQKAENISNGIEVDVYTKQGDMCGGDPLIAHRIVTLLVKGNEVFADHLFSQEWIPFDDQYHGKSEELWRKEKEGERIGQ